jgi:hypothetical protein
MIVFKDTRADMFTMGANPIVKLSGVFSRDHNAMNWPRCS